MKGEGLSPAKAKMVDQEGCLVRVIHHDRVDRARREQPPRLNDLADWFKTLGDPGRLTILYALMGGEMCVCDIATLLGKTDSAVSHQLRRLKDKALVKSRRDGKILYYSLDDEHVVRLLELARVHRDHKE